MQLPVESTMIPTLRENGIAGDTFIQWLAQELLSKFFFRKAKDPLIIIGNKGTGKSLVASSISKISAKIFECEEIKRMNGYECHLMNQEMSQILQDFHKSNQSKTPKCIIFENVQFLTESEQKELCDYIDFSQTSVKTQGNFCAWILTADNTQNACQHLVSRFSNQITLSDLYEREKDLSEIISFISYTLVKEQNLVPYEVFSLRAQDDCIQAVQVAKEPSFIRLTQMLREILFDHREMMKTQTPLLSSMVAPYIQKYFTLSTEAVRQSAETRYVEQMMMSQYQTQVIERLAIANEIPVQTLMHFFQGVSEILQNPKVEPRSYRNITSRIQQVMKLALWATTSAQNQTDFRKFFGTKNWQMPSKSVAWQLFHDVFGAGTTANSQDDENDEDVI